jgi:hypothetical protein
MGIFLLKQSQPMFVGWLKKEAAALSIMKMPIKRISPFF